ncbi:MAG: hypothetical protein ACOCPM_07195 [Bacteroidales bacterium]
MDERTKINHNQDTSRDRINRVSESYEHRTVPPESPGRKIITDIIILLIVAIAALFVTTIILTSWKIFKF